MNHIWSKTIFSGNTDKSIKHKKIDIFLSAKRCQIYLAHTYFYIWQWQRDN